MPLSNESVFRQSAAAAWQVGNADKSRFKFCRREWAEFAKHFSLGRGARWLPYFLGWDWHLGDSSWVRNPASHMAWLNTKFCVWTRGAYNVESSKQYRSWQFNFITITTITSWRRREERGEGRGGRGGGGGGGAVKDILSSYNGQTDLMRERLKLLTFLAETACMKQPDASLEYSCVRSMVL